MIKETEQLSLSVGSKVLVIGLGLSGVSAVKFCLQQEATVRVSDSSAKIEDTLARWLIEHGVEYELGGHSEEFFGWADLILVSPGVPLDIPVVRGARAKGVQVVGELALAPFYLKTPVIAVTGTNGKTTVTTMIGELLKVAGLKVFVGGNIGTPLTDYLVGSQDADWLVLEVSSFQLDTASGFRPDIGVLLNISPDHLDRYHSYEDYVRSKLIIFAAQTGGDRSIVNVDDMDSVNMLAKEGVGCGERQILFFGKGANGRCAAEFSGSQVRIVQDQETYDLAGTGLADSPNLDNAAAVILAAKAAGCGREAIKKGLAGFRPLPHRMTLVEEIDGVRYLDDSKATNMGAVYSALVGLSAPIILIAGGRDKGGDYQMLVEVVRRKVKSMLLIGEAKERMATAFKKLTVVEMMDSLGQAVARANELSCPGDVVLLSPACASFDMFSGYVERGRVFQELVRKLKN